MRKSLLSFAVIVVLSVSTLTASAQTAAASQAVSGSNPRPQAVSGSNPRPTSLAGTVYSALLACFGFSGS